MSTRKLQKALKRALYLPFQKNLPTYIKNKVTHAYLKVLSSTKVAYPSTVMLELTNQCNLACTICPREHEYGWAMDKGSMSLELAKRVIDEVSPYVDSIGLTGLGETFLYKHLAEVVEHIRSKSKGIIISASTNAVAPNFIAKAQEIIGKVDTLQISIDGVDEVYNSIRRNSNFRTLNHNLLQLTKMCQGTSTELKLNMVVTEENYVHMASLVRYAKSIGVKHLDYSVFNLAAAKNIPASYYSLYQSEAFLRATKELCKVISSCRSTNVAHNDFHIGSNFRDCPFPWTHFYITHDGFVVPCCAKPFPKEMNFGNIGSSTLQSVLNSSDFRAWRKQWLNGVTPRFCQKCNFVAGSSEKQQN